MTQVEKWLECGCPTSRIALFAEAVGMTRQKCHGMSIGDIAKCFKAQFDAKELQALISELSS
jgi:hypothetical protein